MTSSLRLLAGLALADGIAGSGIKEVGCARGYEETGECLVDDESQLLQRDMLLRNIAASDLARPRVRPQDAAHFKANMGDYDCDSDGVRDCGTFDYEMAMCANQDLCGQQYKWGDLTLDQSCRCRKCPVTHGDAFGDEYFKDPAGSGAPFDAQYWGTFKNWGDHLDTCAPWLMPKDDEDLRQVLAYAKSQGYMVRISGTGHSAGGIVTDGDDSSVVVVSLAEYTAPGEWEFGVTDMPDGSKRAKVNAGWTQFHVTEKMRPMGFFLPTHTAGYFFSLGGVVGNSVHGGSYNDGFIHTYATRARVMLANGTITIIGQEDMKFWRNSFGLNGIMLGIELQMEKRDQMQMYTVREDLPSWSSESLWNFIKQKSEAMLPDEEVPTDGGVGSKKSFSGEFFLDFLNCDSARILSVSMKANSSVDADFDGGTPADITTAYEELGGEKVYEDGRGSMTWSESARRDGAPPIKILGIELSDILEGLKSFSVLARITSGATLEVTASDVKEMAAKTNDGYFLRYAIPVATAAYFFPASKAFEVLDFFRNAQVESLTDEDFVWSVPASFRFVNVQDAAVLQPVPAGHWLNVEMLTYVDLAKNHQAWKRAFKKVEDYWVNELGGVPHMGKLFGFEEKNGQVEPFSDHFTCSIYSDAQKEEFDNYRKLQDPDGLFASGLAMKFLKDCP